LHRGRKKPTTLANALRIIVLDIKKPFLDQQPFLWRKKHPIERFYHNSLALYATTAFTFVIQITLF
jgi:hypothetical protein